MVVQKFSENFWSPDFTSTVGFDALVKKNKDGKTSSKEIEYFIKERAKIEDEYAKSLLKLSKASLGSTESGSLKDVLTSLRNNVEKLSYLHQDLSQILLDQVDRVHAERDKFSSQCKVVEESVKRLQGIKKDLHKQTIASSISYQKKSEAYEVSIQACNAERAQAQSIGNPPKALRELEKLEAKSLKCKDEKIKADDIYKGLVRQLEVTRASWETEMETMCDTFQQVENDRILFFRNELWALTNFDSKTLFDQDQVNEEARLVITKCDPDSDIQEFIHVHQTGSVRPAQILYEDFDAKGGRSTIRPTLPHVQRPAAPPPTSASTFFTDNGTHATVKDDEMLDPTYSSIG